MDNYFSDRHCELDELTRVYGKNDIYDYVRFLILTNQKFSISLVDIDNFKFINDTYGIESAKKVLYKVAQRIKEKIGDRGCVGRIEGDKFIIVLKDMTTYDEVWSMSHALLVDINELHFSEFAGLNLTLTIGLARFPDNASTFEDLIKATEKALYRGKTKGRNCFIIYLPEKHANIVIKSEKDKALSSTNLHSTVFKFLSSDDLSDGITSLFNFLSSYFELDHICLQSNGRLLFQKIHQLAKNQEFEAVPAELIKNTLNQNTEMYCLNDVKNLLQTKQMDLFECLAKQNITSTCYIDISYQGESFGMLRADMTGTGKNVRIWQYADLDILLTTAKTIAFILHFTGKQLNSI